MNRTYTSPIQDLLDQVGMGRVSKLVLKTSSKCNRFACDPILYQRNSASREIFLLTSFICCKLATKGVVILTVGPSLKNLHV